MGEKIRLQKFIAAAGLTSRRKAEELIRSGRVRVNGQVVTDVATKVDPDTDVVEVDGERVRLPKERTYILLHKPRGVLSTTHDPYGRPTVVDLVPVARRLFPVGRLDADSEGLILLTDDGAVAERLTHPRYGHPKEYIALVIGVPEAKALRALRRGILLDGERVAVADVKVLGRRVPQEILAAGAPGLQKISPKGFSWVRVVVTEGRKHLVRRLLKAVGHPVIRLFRVGMGPLRLGRLKPGQWRPLTPKEKERLFEALGLTENRAQEHA